MTDSVLVIGAGVAGLHAALECSAAGARAIVVERGPVVGGRLAAPMSRPGAIGDRAEGLEVPLFDVLAANDAVEILTNAELVEISGGPGNFDVSIRERARFVTDACTRCKLCHTVCPVVRPNDYDAGLTFRKAIYTPMADTLPAAYAIDIESCLNAPPNYLPCNRCVEVCDDDAIHFDLPLESAHRRNVGAVILAPGFRVDDSACAELGYGAHPDIVTSAELQRLLEDPGPTGGYASRPSNEEYPASVLLVLENLSRFGFYIAASQVRQLLEQDIETVAVLVLGEPASAGEVSEAREFADEAGIALRWGAMFRAEETDGDVVTVSYEDLTAHRLVRSAYELVVLCTDVVPPEGLGELAQAIGVELAEDGFVTSLDAAGVATTRAGIFVAGAASGAKTVRDSLADATAAAQAAVAELHPGLLKPGSPAAPGQPRPGASAPGESAGLQHQIERLLYALLNRPDNQDGA